MKEIDKIDSALRSLEQAAFAVHLDIDSDHRYQRLCELVTKYDWDSCLLKAEKQECRKNWKYLLQKISIKELE